MYRPEWSRHAFASVIIAMAASSLTIAQAQIQNAQSYPLNNYVRVLDGQWEGIRYASDGNVYFGSSTHSAHHGAAFFKYDPRTKALTMLAEDITIICGENPQTNPQGKLHSDIVEAAGWIYFSTHFGWAAQDGTVPPGAYATWTGAHVIGYQLSSGAFRDFGVIHPHYTSYSGIGVDAVRNYIYVLVTGMTDGTVTYLYRIDIATGVKTNLGQVGGTYASGYYLFVDQRGDVWFSLEYDGGALHRYHADTGVIDTYANALPQLYLWSSETVDPNPTHQSYRQILWMQPLDGNRAILTLTAGDTGGMLYLFDSTKPVAQAFTNIKFIGYSYSGMALGDNRVFYYQRANNGYGYQGETDFHLLSVSLNPADNYAITDHGLLQDQNARLVWRVPGMATDGTNRVFMVGDWWTVAGDLGTLRWDWVNGVESYVQLPRGEFFAEADVNLGAVSVAPSIVTLHANQTRQFTATVQGLVNQSVNWSISPTVGTISAAGLYTAPPAVAATQTVIVTAVSVADSTRTGTANITLRPPASVTVSPPSPGMMAAQTRQFTATLLNATDQSVTWSLNPPSTGSISATGLYTAPPTVLVAQTVTVIATSVEDPTASGSTIVTLNVPTPPWAALAGTDTVTQGNWKGVYGADGYNIINSAASYPAYVTVTQTGAAAYSWVASTTEVRALEKAPPATDHIAAAWYGIAAWSIDIAPGDTLPHQVAVYCLDWDRLSRVQTLEVLEGSTGAVLDTRPVSNFGNGVYVVWKFSGHIKIRVTRTGPSNGVISGVFFDPGPAISVTVAPPAAALSAGQTQQFNATLQNTGDQSVTWHVSPQTGTVSTTGLYTAPASISSTQTVTVTATSVADPARSGSAIVTLNPPGLITVTVNPATATIGENGGQQFTATVAGSSNQAVTWSLMPSNPDIGGLIGNSGHYIPPMMIFEDQTVIVTATSVADPARFGTATITLTQAAMGVSVLPRVVALLAGQSQQFAATVQNSSNQAVNWSAEPGRISSSGLYTAPPIMDTSLENIVVTARSVADPAKYGTAKIIPISSSVPVIVPAAATLAPNQAQQFTVARDFLRPAQPVTWSISPAVGNILPNGIYVAPPSVAAQQTVTVTATSVQYPTLSASVPVTLVPTPPTGTAVYTMTISMTQGTWKGTLGADGYNVIGNAISYPSYVTVTPPAAAGTFIWNASTSDVRALQKAGATTDRIAAAWFSASPFEIDLNFNDGNPHLVAFYCLDWDAASRTQTMDILDANNILLDTRGMTYFSGGFYQQWELSGHVKLRVTKTAGVNGVISGIFFDTSASVRVKVDPGVVTLGPNQTQRLINTVRNTTNQAVTWSLVPATGTIVCDSASTATYTAPPTVSGNPVVAVIATSVADPTKSGIAVVRLRPTASVVVAPQIASLSQGQTQQFNADTSPVYWSISPPVGSISTAGLYTAPAVLPAAQIVTVTAISTADPTRIGTAAVALIPTTGVAVSVTPAQLRMGQADSVSFTATVTGSTNTAVTWSVSPVVGSYSVNGNVLNYISPDDIQQDTVITIKATSVADTTRFATAIVTLSMSVGVTVSPQFVTLGPGQTQQFTATVENSANQAVTWDGASSTGLYTAPASFPLPPLNTVEVLATSVADPNKFGWAKITLIAPASVQVSPNRISLGPNQARLFSAVVGNTANQAVTWSISPSVGAILSNGLYVAPSTIAATQTVTVTAASVQNPAISGSATVTLVTAPVTGTAIYAMWDGIDQGTWKGVLGTDGYNVVGASASYPSYVTVTPPANAGSYTFAPSTSDVRALQKPGAASDRIAAAWYATGPFEIDLNLLGSTPRRVAFYCLDWDSTARTQTMDILDANNVLIDSQVMTNFHGGVYMQWVMSGHVKLRVTRTAGTNGLISGVFFDTALAPRIDLTPAFATLGATMTQQFNLTVQNSSNQAVTWSLVPAGTGTISAAGLYTAPSTVTAEQVVGVCATSVADNTVSACSVVRLVPVPVVSPMTVTLTAGQTQQFTATMPVNWLLGTPPLGTISSSGLYTAPATIGSIQTVTVTAISIADTTKFGTAIVTLTPSNPPSDTASFVKLDTTTQGNWKGIYGSNGYHVIGDAVSYPSYVTVTQTGAPSYTWVSSTSDVRAPRKAASSTDRIAAAWYGAAAWTIDLVFNDGQLHQVAMYCLDWDTNSRAQKVEVFDSSHTALHSLTLTGFHNGQYVVWQMGGHVQIQITKTAGDNGVVSGLFFDPATPPGVSVSVSPPTTTLGPNQTQAFSATVQGTANQSVTWTVFPLAGGVSTAGLYTAPATITAQQTVTVTATSAADNSKTGTAIVTLTPGSGSGTAAFVAIDSATQGNWKGVYGTAGYNVVDDTAVYPSFVTVTPPAVGNYVWAASSTDVRALRKAASSTDRIAATWYYAAPFIIDLNFSDASQHKAAIYCVDWDSNWRAQTVEILDADNTVLDTRGLADFHSGKYLVWMLSGHVKIRITPTASNAVVSGIFFE